MVSLNPRGFRGALKQGLADIQEKATEYQATALTVKRLMKGVPGYQEFSGACWSSRV